MASQNLTALASGETFTIFRATEDVMDQFQTVEGVFTISMTVSYHRRRTHPPMRTEPVRLEAGPEQTPSLFRALETLDRAYRASAVAQLDP